MAEYIEKQELLNDTRIRKDDSGVIKTRKLLFRNYIKNTPTADVIPLEKIKEILDCYDGSMPSMITCFSEIQKLIESEEKK